MKNIPSHSTIIIGLSGGPDSVYLLHKLVALSKSKNLKLIVAHIDHQWRPNSADDVTFCTTLADQLNLPFETATFADIIPFIKTTGSKEADGRTARRYFFESLQKKYNANAIALAHHKQDQQENFFIRLLRGSSLDGLVGMKEQEGSYIRPLLAMDKSDIITYLDSHTIPYLTDPSNESPEFLRNRVRAELIPVLTTIDSRFEKNFATTLARLKEAQEYLQRQTDSAYKSVSSNNTLALPLFFELDPYLQQRVILQWLISHGVTFTPSYGLIQEILRFLKQPGSKEHTIHNTWKIIKKKGTAAIAQI